MSASKRPSTSSLRRFITSRPYVTVAELRRRFGLDEPDAMVLLRHNGTTAWIGLPDREAIKLQDLWDRNELGMELSVEVRAPVVVGVYPMRIARYVIEVPAQGNTHWNGNRRDPQAYAGGTQAHDRRWDPPDTMDEVSMTDDGARARHWLRRDQESSSAEAHAPRPMPGAPSYGVHNRPPTE